MSEIIEPWSAWQEEYLGLLATQALHFEQMAAVPGASKRKVIAARRARR